MKELVETDRLNTILNFTDFYLDRQNKYTTQIAQLNKQLTALREKLTVLELNLRKRGDTAAAATATKSAKSNTTFQKAVKITFEGASGVSDKTVSLSVSYLISNASWEPLYHVRVSVPEVKTEHAKSLIQVCEQINRNSEILLLDNTNILLQFLNSTESINMSEEIHHLLVGI